MTDTTKPSGVKRRGFASMDAAKLQEITSLGGKTAHQLGKAHKWDSESAREAGRKGGIAARLKKAGR